jgi:hypothetical protein
VPASSLESCIGLSPSCLIISQNGKGKWAALVAGYVRVAGRERRRTKFAQLTCDGGNEKSCWRVLFSNQLDAIHQPTASLSLPDRRPRHLIYRYRISDHEWKVERRSVRLDWTPCHFGGQRAWFLCPHCDRRVAVLHGSATIACRHCFRLAYSCTREGKARRAGRRAEKIRARLKWRRGIAWGPDRKPRYMHWDTFFKLAGQVAELTTVAMAPTLRQLGIRSNL